MKKFSPAKKWLMVLVVVCLGFLLYDMSQNTEWGKDLVPASGQQTPAGTDGNQPSSDQNDQNAAPAPTNSEPQVALPGVDPEVKADGSQDDAATTAANVYYEDYRQEREKVRSQELELLKEIVDNPNSSQQSKDQAQARQMTIAQNMEDEMLIESLMSAKNFQQAAAFIQEKQVTVVLNGQVTPEEASQIADIVDGVTNIGYENVVVIQKEQS